MSDLLTRERQQHRIACRVVAEPGDNLDTRIGSGSGRGDRRDQAGRIGIVIEPSQPERTDDDDHVVRLPDLDIAYAWLSSLPDPLPELSPLPEPLPELSPLPEPGPELSSLPEPLPEPPP